jgi:hypothetical protein
MKLRITNKTRKTLLGDAISVANTSATRRTGLLKHTGLGRGEGLWITPCESVHTFFMKFPIDLVYLDRKRIVKKVRDAMPAWRMSVCFSAHSIIELPAGVVKETGTAAGDELEFEELG